jgi:hypothetical protein
MAKKREEEKETRTERRSINAVGFFLGYYCGSVWSLIFL